MNAYLFGCEPYQKIWLESLHMADDPQSFLRYPWGHECFLRFLAGIQKKDLRSIRKKDDDGVAKYTVTGYSIALQYWAYESIDRIGRLATTVVKDGHGFPRMLRWKTLNILSKKQVQSFFTGNMVPIRRKLLPRSDVERAYLRRESFTCPWRLVREYELDDDMATDDLPRPSQVDTVPMATDDPPRPSHVDSTPGPSARGELRSPPVEARTHNVLLRDEVASLRDAVASLRDAVGGIRSDIASLRAEQAATGSNVSAMLGILSTLVGPRTPHSAPPPPTASYSARPPSFTDAPPPPPAYSALPPHMAFSSPSLSVQSARTAPSSAQKQEGDDVAVDDYLLDVVPQEQ